jgi:hypothetical protein
MTNDIKDLRAKSQEYIELGKKITKNVILLMEHEDVEESNPIALKISDGKYIPATEHDYEAWVKTEGIIDHIAELQKRLDDYEARVQRLAKFEKRAKQGGGDGDTIEAMEFKNGKWRGVSRCLEIMTGEDKG